MDKMACTNKFGTNKEHKNILQALFLRKKIKKNKNELISIEQIFYIKKIGY